MSLLRFLLIVSVLVLEAFRSSLAVKPLEVPDETDPRRVSWPSAIDRIGQVLKSASPAIDDFAAYCGNPESGSTSLIDSSDQWSDASDLLGGLGDHQTALGLSLGANALYRMVYPRSCALEPAPVPSLQDEAVYEFGLVITGLAMAAAQLRDSSRNIGATVLAEKLNSAEISLLSASTNIFKASELSGDCPTLSTVLTLASAEMLNAGNDIEEAAEEITSDSWWPWTDICTCGEVKKGDGEGGKVQKVCVLRQGYLCPYCDWAASDSDIFWSLIWSGATEKLAEIWFEDLFDVGNTIFDTYKMFTELPDCLIIMLKHLSDVFKGDWASNPEAVRASASFFISKFKECAGITVSISSVEAGAGAFADGVCKLDEEIRFAIGDEIAQAWMKLEAYFEEDE